MTIEEARPAGPSPAGGGASASAAAGSVAASAAAAGSVSAAPGAQRSIDRSSLIIDRVETIALRAPLGRRFVGSAYSMINRCTIITRLYTRDGLVSEVYTGDTDDEQDLVVGIIHDELAPALIGQTAADPESAWRLMEPSTNNILRDRGLALQAIACLDTAIWDVLGKAIAQPLFRIWGAVADALPISIIGGYYHLSNDEIPGVLESYVEKGFSGVKFKVGGRSPAVDAARVRAASEAIRGRMALMVDANQGYTRAQAVEFGRLVRDLDIRWFEEPCRWSNDRRWMRDVRYQTGIPVTAGQSEFTLGGLRDLVVEGAIDVSNFDASWSGGPTIWRKAAGLCAAFGVQMGHHEEPQVSSHLLASVPDHTFVECFDEERDPFFWHLTDMSTRVADGKLRLSEGAGFGMNLDWDYVRQHTVATRVTG